MADFIAWSSPEVLLTQTLSPPLHRCLWPPPASDALQTLSHSFSYGVPLILQKFLLVLEDNSKPPFHATPQVFGKLLRPAGEGEGASEHTHKILLKEFFSLISADDQSTNGWNTSSGSSLHVLLWWPASHYKKLKKLALVLS